jgi:hypothetical protein
MAQKKIISVGLDIASDDVEYCDFDSDISLLDWDIILFKPVIHRFQSYAESFQGKPSLSDSMSFLLKERSEHWRREINDAVDSGKTVIVYLTDLEEVYIDTGERRYSGTGRNQKTTRILSEYNNYYSIPASLSPVKTKGSEIKLVAKGSELISIYWKEFARVSSYKVILTQKNIPACLLTKNGDKKVGAIYRSKNSTGALILVPDIDFYPDEFFKENDDEQEWSKKAISFAARIVKTVVSLDKSLKNSRNLTPEPEWAKSKEYAFEKETSIRSKLLKVEETLKAVHSKKEQLLCELKDVGRLRNLLFEKGKPLEYAILDALKILGFDASNFDNGESEFDAVFEASEGRLIGEAEGKDNKAINIDKLRQLAMNIHEDLEREEVETPAKGVLFGNAFRLTPLDERSEPFTVKCVNASFSNSTALVFTPDLFKVAHYLSNKRNVMFASKCRKAIVGASGRVQFPELPNSGTHRKPEVAELETYRDRDAHR